MTEFFELIPGLPEEIALECLSRLPYTAHHSSAQVCRRWRKFLKSIVFYYHRKENRHTQKFACLVQALPVQSEPDRVKPIGPPSYGLSVFDPVSGDWDRLDPVPKYPDGLPLFCQLCSCEGKLIVMGGWDPVTWEPIKGVFVYDFINRRWSKGKDMPSKRSFFASAAIDGRVFIAGGHDENKNALKSACAYDVREDEWTELTPMSQERDECEGVIIGSELWVVSGYCTESQGRFEKSAEVFEPEKNQWRRVEDAWGLGQCPRSCIGVNKEKNLISWAESEPAVRLGVCGVELGDRTLVTGSAYQGAPPGFFLAHRYKGQNGKLEKISVPDTFQGFVQSGCCVEI